MSEKLDAALLALGQLTTPDELKAVIADARGRLSHLDPGTEAAALPLESEVDFILETMQRVLSSMGVEHTSVATLRGSPQYAAFKQKAPAIVAYLDSACPTNRVKQIAVLSIGVRLLYENLASQGFPVSSRFLMTHIHRLPSVMNRAFPGYARAGLLNLLVKDKTNVRNEQGRQHRSTT